MKKYELLLVLPGTLDENEAEVRAQEIVNLVKENASEVELVTMGKNRLAYPIKQIRYGYFYTIIFEAEAAGVRVLQDKLALMRDLLRAMISYFNVKYNPAAAAPAPLKEDGDGSGSEEVVPTQTEEVKEKETEEAAPAAKKAGKTPLDLKEIDKKLDEILDENNLVAGV